MGTIPKYRTINVEILYKAETAPVGSVLQHDGVEPQWVARPKSTAYLVTKTEQGFALMSDTDDLGRVNIGQKYKPCVSCRSVGVDFRDKLEDVLEPAEDGAYLGLIAPLGRVIGWATLPRTFGTESR